MSSLCEWSMHCKIILSTYTNLKMHNYHLLRSAMQQHKLYI